jgi:hypothetical protein
MSSTMAARVVRLLYHSGAEPIAGLLTMDYFLEASVQNERSLTRTAKQCVT